MGTIVSYKITGSYILTALCGYMVTIYYIECLNKINEKLNTHYNLYVPFEVSEETLNKIRPLLKNYVGTWSI